MLNGHTGVIYHFYKLQLCYYLNLITRQNNKSLNISKGQLDLCCKQEDVHIMLILKVVPHLNLF